MVEQSQYQINLDKNVNEKRSLMHLFTEILCKECKKQYKSDEPSASSVLVKMLFQKPGLYTFGITAQAGNLPCFIIQRK